MEHMSGRTAENREDAVQHEVLSAIMRRASDMQRQKARVLYAALARVPALAPIAARRVAVPTEDSNSDDDDGDDDASPKRNGPQRVMLERPSCRTLLDAMSSVCQFAMPTTRLVFVCGSEGRILRSADRCRSWRAMKVAAVPTDEARPVDGITETNAEGDTVDPEAEVGAGAPGDRDLPSSKAAKAAGRDEVAAILAMLPARSRAIAGNAVGGTRGQSIAAGTGITAAKAARDVKQKQTAARNDLFGIDAYAPAGHVAACGARGTLLFSVNNGASFDLVPTAEALEQIMAAMGLGAPGGSDTDSDDGTASIATSAGMGVKRALRHVLVVGPFRVVVAAGSYVAFLRLARKADGFVVADAQLLCTMERDVRLVARTDKTGTHGELFVCAAHQLARVVLAREADGAFTGRGSTHMHIAHSLGTIMALQELPPAAAARMPAPQPLKAAMTADNRGKNVSVKTSFSYAADTVLTATQLESLAECENALPAPHGAASPVRGRVFAVYCSGGRVVPYDWTCAMWLHTTDADEIARTRVAAGPDVPLSVVISSVCNVEHMPFVTANTKKDRVGVAVLDRGLTWVRSCPGGIAVSKDAGATWSNPQHAFTGRCIALDNTEACVVCMKPAVAMRRRRKVKQPRTIAAASSKAPAAEERLELTDDWELQPLPRTLRMAVIHDAAVIQ
jgi:hypothetical protein